MTQQTQPPGAALGSFAAPVNDALKRLAAANVMARIWDRDHTVWKDDPAEIADRLGWLTVPRDMMGNAGDLRAFAEQIRSDGFRDVVLLGMGGSSLGPEVIRQCIGAAPGFPRLTVLDSTVPARVATVSGAIDPARTLFVVSSKSGGTIEPNSLYKHFRPMVEQAAGAENAVACFVAVTDPGTSLAALAARDGFRRTFENPPDIGGRYSVGSYFGLVPAALIGVDCRELLQRVTQMASRCEAGVGARNNAGGWLGAAIGAMALEGRDKLTLITSPAIASFGLWVEQLIAESTGKEGRGIVPVANEPLLGPDDYGDDRTFVYMRLAGGENAETDVAAERLAGFGHPVITLDLDDPYDIGAEFFRWEFATAVAGHLLGIHPFDQPDVQAAKDATDRVLADYVRDGAFPAPNAGSAADLIDQAVAGDYLAVMVYAEETEGVSRAVNALRQRVMRRRKIATTLGYGPRFLHSTGQIHKGGPDAGLFLQLTVNHDPDVEIPGEPYGFGALASAQALGDYQALLDAGRRVATVDLGRDAESGVLRLLGTI